MKRSYMILALLSCMCTQVSAGEESPTLTRGDSIGDHLTALKKYGDGTPLLKTPAGVPGTTEVMMWKVGDGVLIVEMTIGAGIIIDISYVIITGNEKNATTLKVKEFNPANGEMTIITSNTATDPWKRFTAASEFANEQTPEDLANAVLQRRVASCRRVGVAKPGDDVFLMELDAGLYQAALDSKDKRLKAIVAIKALKSMPHLVKDAAKRLSEEEKEERFRESSSYKKLKSWYLELIHKTH